MTSDSDFMELGDSGYVPLRDGWTLETATGNRISPAGAVYSANGEILKEVDLDEDEDSV